MKKALYLGIDPGSTTGLALWHPKQQELKLYQFKSHTEAMLFLYDLLKQLDKETIKFRIEDARKTKKRPDLAEVNKGKLQGVGYVKAYSKDWEAFCKNGEWEYEMVAPKNTKVSPQYFEKLTGIKTLKTQSHIRDAGLLIYGI